MALAHPQPERLAAFNAGALDDDESSAIESHLADCPACCTWLDAAADDQWTLQLRAAVNTAPTLAGQPAADDDLPLRPLERLGHYRVLGVIGKGGMGLVLRAHDERLDRVVAIKLMTAHTSDASMRRRFQREARLSAVVSHDHLVPIYAIETEGQVPYIVMQFVEGESLEERLRRGRLPWPETARLAAQLASGLVAAHARGLIHRDVKPANILLERATERAKLTDFGLARVDGAPGLTHTAVIAGTPAFMSPEQANGQPLDQRSDLFGLGSVLYQMCTGELPFQADSSAATLRRVCSQTPRPVRQCNPAVPKWLAAVVERLMAKQPNHRFQTAQEVADVLASHSGEFIDGRTEFIPFAQDGMNSVPRLDHGMNSAFRRFGPRRRAAVALAALVSAVAASVWLSAHGAKLAGMATSQPQSAPGEQGPGEQPPTPSQSGESSSPAQSSEPGAERGRSRWRNVGDGISQLATSALNDPTSLAFDSAGNLYVSNVIGSKSIVKITPSGDTSTFVEHLGQPVPLAFDSAGNLFVALNQDGTIRKLSPTGTQSQFVTSPTNAAPYGLAFDSTDNLYFAPAFTQTIYKATPSGGISIWASSSLLNHPYGLTFDKSGTLYVANFRSDTISKVTPSGDVSTFTADGLDMPFGLVFDAGGELYVSNTGNDTIGRVDGSGATSTFVSGALSKPAGLAFDGNGDLHVVNRGNGTIVKIVVGAVRWAPERETNVD